MFNRMLQEFGILPILAYPLLLILFVGLSAMLFYKTEEASYFYIAVAAMIIIPLSEVHRNEFLSTAYSRTDYRRIRIIENLICTFPFALFLLIWGKFLWAFIPLGIAIVLGFIRIKQSSSRSIPTPFYRYPFEFTTGFRKYWPLFILVYFVSTMAMIVGNFNLGAFTLILVPLICLSFYAPPEERYFVWLESRTARELLSFKITVGIFYTFVLCLPILILLWITFPNWWWISLLLLILGFLYVVLMVVGKYAAYPKPISVPQGLLMMFAVWLPPLLLVIIPYLYLKARKQLNYYLK